MNDSISISLALELVLQLTSLGVLVGLTAARVARPWRPAVARWLGMYERRLDPRWLASVLGLAGGATALLHISLCLATGRSAPGLPMGPLLLGGLAGLSGLGVTALAVGPQAKADPELRRGRRHSGRRGRRRNPPPTEQPRDRRGELLIGGLTPALLVGLSAAGFESRAAALTVIATAAAGAVVAQGWLLVRIPARAAVRRIRRSALRPAPAGVGAISLVGAVGGALASGAALTGGVDTPPSRQSGLVFAVALATLAAVWLPLGRYVALEEISIQRFEIAGRQTVVMSIPARKRHQDQAPVFCVAGWSGDPTEPWLAVFKALARESGRELIAIALPELSAGTGSLEVPRKVPQLVEFLRAAIEQLSPNKPVLLMGSSLGGLVTLTLARDPTAPIVGWVTIGSMGFDMPGLLKVVSHRSFAAPVGRLGMVLPAFVRRSFATPIRRRFSPEVTEAAIRELHMEISDRKEVERVLAHGPRFIMEANHAIDPGQIVFHGLAIWGELDVLSPPHNAGWLRRRRPDLEVVVLEGGSHSVQMNSPELFARVVVGSRAFALSKE